MIASEKIKNNNKIKKEGGIYIHIPFCRSRCGYCAFFTVGTRKADWRPFVEKILEELRSRITEVPDIISTLYIGGGTPSQMPEDSFTALIKGIREILSEEGKEIMIKEFTIECNPDDVTIQKAEAWKRGGINRVSLGVQSFDEDELKILERHHKPEHVSMAIDILKRKFENISIDLIFGIPGQSLEDWKNNLNKAFSYGINHLSAYSLSYEERTLLTYRRKQGEIKEVEDVDMTGLYNELLESAGEHGFRHYEISNFALPGYESVHNSSYWIGKPYLGLGPSASSYDGGRRRITNISDFNNWIGRSEEEELTEEECREEYILTRLRREEGIELSNYIERFGEKEGRKLMERCLQFEQKRELKISENSIRVTGSGWMLHDYICCALI